MVPSKDSEPVDTPNDRLVEMEGETTENEEEDTDTKEGEDDFFVKLQLVFSMPGFREGKVPVALLEAKGHMPVYLQGYTLEIVRTLLHKMKHDAAQIELQCRQPDLSETKKKMLALELRGAESRVAGCLQALKAMIYSTSVWRKMTENNNQVMITLINPDTWRGQADVKPNAKWCDRHDVDLTSWATTQE